MSICERDGCPDPGQGNHYHCGRCNSAEMTSMMGHYTSSDGGKTWHFTCKEEDIVKEKDMGRSMSFDGEEGYFLTVEEYEELQEHTEEDEKLEELEIENSNLREAISQAYEQARDLKALLGNA